MAQLRFIAILALANAFVWGVPAPHGLTVSFFDVGEGDAVFIQGPTGARVLVDGGPVGGGVLRGIGERLPFFARSLDAVVETTPLSSESGGLAGVFSRYRVRNFLTSSVSGDTKTADVLSRAAARQDSKTGTLSRGARILLGGGAYLDVLSPEPDAKKLDAHSGALVLRVVYGRTSFLLSSEAPRKTESALAAAYGSALRSDVLLAGEHGSKNASAPAFVSAVSPSVAVISRGCDNRFGHPATSTVETLRSAGAAILDTCERGAVTFSSTGAALMLQ